MIANIFAWTPGLMELLATFFVFMVPVILIVLFIVFIIRSSKKRRKLRFELDKLAAELEQMHQQAKSGAKDNSTTESR